MASNSPGRLSYSGLLGTIDRTGSERSWASHLGADCRPVISNCRSHLDPCLFRWAYPAATGCPGRHFAAVALPIIARLARIWFLVWLLIIVGLIALTRLILVLLLFIVEHLLDGVGRLRHRVGTIVGLIARLAPIPLPALLPLRRIGRRLIFALTVALVRLALGLVVAGLPVAGLVLITVLFGLLIRRAIAALRSVGLGR